MILKNILPTILAVFIILVGVFLGALFLPWRTINWGSIQLMNDQTITITGEAKLQIENQTASFSAGVDAVNDDKNKAIEEVNNQVTKLIQSAKDFGIPEEDVKTQNISVYQNDETYYDSVSGTQKTRKGQWRVSNNVEFKLKDIKRSEEFASLLAKSGATNVYGPNFVVEDTKSSDSELIKMAIEDATVKAQSIAEASGGKLGKIVKVQEGSGAEYPVMYRDMGAGGGGGTPLEPGTSTVTKYLTVTYELR